MFFSIKRISSTINYNVIGHLNNRVKVIQKSDPTKTEFKRVDGVYLFRKDIKPEYEDIKNLHGSIYKYEVIYRILQNIFISKFF
jgi:hypothetical protein